MTNQLGTLAQPLRKAATATIYYACSGDGNRDSDADDCRDQTELLDGSQTLTRFAGPSLSHISPKVIRLQMIDGFLRELEMRAVYCAAARRLQRKAEAPYLPMQDNHFQLEPGSAAAWFSLVN